MPIETREIVIRAEVVGRGAALEAGNKSPDLTCIGQVVAGDTLPNLCRAVCGEPSTFVQVARTNRLDPLGSLAPGAHLMFPPLRMN